MKYLKPDLQKKAKERKEQASGKSLGVKKSDVAKLPPQEEKGKVRKQLAEHFDIEDLVIFLKE